MLQEDRSRSVSRLRLSPYSSSSRQFVWRRNLRAHPIRLPLKPLSPVWITTFTSTENSLPVTPTSRLTSSKTAGLKCLFQRDSSCARLGSTVSWSLLSLDPAAKATRNFPPCFPILAALLWYWKSLFPLLLPRAKRVFHSLPQFLVSPAQRSTFRARAWIFA